MLPLLIRFLNRFQPREGWAPFLLVLVALLCPPAALIEANSDLDAMSLLAPTALAAIVGLRIARSRLSAGGATALGGLLGGGLVLVVVGRLLPPWSLLWTEITYTADWLGLWRRGVVNFPLPFASLGGFVGQQLNALGIRLWWWWQTVASGGPARDPLAFLLFASFLAWAFGCFAAWQIYRRRSALVGLLPSGVAVATISFFRGGLAFLYLMTYLFCTLWLIAACHLWVRRDHWEQIEADYPGDLGVELVLVLAPGLTLLLLLAAFFPVVHPRQVRDAFWKVMDGPWSAVERASERLFGPIARQGPTGGSLGGFLPRAHLLGGGSDLDETVVFYVATNDPPPPRPDPGTASGPRPETASGPRPGTASGPRPAEPEAVEFGPPRRYWRSATFDTYTGQGWINGPSEQRTFPANQPLNPNLPPGFELLQQFDLVVSGRGELYAVNAPLCVDHAVQSWWRGPGDLVEMSSAAGRYTVVSRLPEPSVADLRNAPAILPPDLAQRYLALPEGVPQRVLDLAEEVVGQAETRYDQARAIETYLRAYTYTLDLPDPPADRDLVDYFLFERQEGYCDYYASAMVVMARAAGIPARLATGYAQGTYDYDRKGWTVVEKDGHSWVEVYFDRIGWVEFEPTAGRPGLDRPGGRELPRPVVPPLPPRTVRWWQRVPWALVAMAGFLLLAVAVVAWIWRSRRQQAPAAADLVFDRYLRLLGWGARLKQPLRDGQTPLEYSAALNETLRAHGRGSRWSQVRQAGVEAPPEVERLTETFVRAQYSCGPIGDREGWRIRDLWIRLRRHLWWLWLGKR